MVAVKKDRISGDALGTGRRKSAVARVRVRAGSGKVLVNGIDVSDYFKNEQDRRAALEPLYATGKQEALDVIIRAEGGGTTGQAGACRMGIARALYGNDEGTLSILREGKFLTRDSRMKERKKYGLRGARRGTQFSKR
jgi:small subunit ribosomal protein S9